MTNQNRVTRKLKGDLFQDKDENLFFLNDAATKIEWLGIILENVKENKVMCYNCDENLYSLVEIIKEPMHINNVVDIMAMHPNANLPKSFGGE